MSTAPNASARPLREPGRLASLFLSAGARSAMPVYLLLIMGFVAPLVAVVSFSFAAPRTFTLFETFTFANYAAIFDPANTVWTSFVWSLTLAAATVAILALITYPIAYGLAHVFGKWASLVSLLFVFPLFVSENIRLYGWVLFFIKGGILDGTLSTYFGVRGPEFLFTWGATLFGMVYVYLPFMLFPITLGLSAIPKDLIEVARDLGASRFQIWREVELPLAMPGILIGMLLTFVLAAGAVAESRILGGQAIISITQDIETAFTYAQNWPLGSALAVLLMLVIGTLVLFGMSKLDLDRILGRR
jgi:spermidine/putrescine transport system permease protein